jgi:serine/threonine protein phosphatase 1
LGDYIDRGPDSKGCIDRILRFRAESPGTVVALLGNHEDGLIKALKDSHCYSWLAVMERFATVRSYSAAAADVLGRAVEAAGPRVVLERIALPYDAFLDAIPSEHLTFFEGLKSFWRTSDGVCVHGGLDPRGSAVEVQTHEAMIWGTATFLTVDRNRQE